MASSEQFDKKPKFDKFESGEYYIKNVLPKEESIFEFNKIIQKNPFYNPYQSLADLLHKLKQSDLDTTEKKPGVSLTDPVEKQHTDKEDFAKQMSQLATENQTLRDQRDSLNRSVDQLHQRIDMHRKVADELGTRNTNLLEENRQLKSSEQRWRNSAKEWRELAERRTATTDLLDPEGYCKVLGIDPKLVRTLPSGKLERLLTSLYRAYSLVHHPDTGGNTEAMKAVNTAYDFLKNPQKRRTYGR